MMKHGYHKYLLYASLVFLILAVYKADYLKIPHIRSTFTLFLAFIFLFGGFILTAISQQRLLKKYNYPVRTPACDCGCGAECLRQIHSREILGGGRKSIVHRRKRRLSGRRAFNAVCAGPDIGVMVRPGSGDFRSFSQRCPAVGRDGRSGGPDSLSRLLLFAKRAQDAALGLVKRLFGKELTLPMLEIRHTMALIPWFMGVWLFWGIGFYLLAIGISDQVFPFSTIFCFPLAATVGIVFLFAPGGLGIREGIIAGYLALLNIPLPEAITVSAASRLWFLMGELFIFLAGYLSNKIRP